MKKIYIITLSAALTGFTLKAAEISSIKKIAPASKISLTGCSQTSAQADLDISNVRARMLGGGDMWWDMVGSPAYEVPKGSGKTSFFAGSIWIGGLDAGGNIKTACQNYRQSGNDYWAGPIDPSTGNITSANCLAYDRHWKLDKSDVVNFVNTGATVPDIISYPGNSPYASTTPLAPYFDNNGDGTYNYLDGDYPYFNLSSGTPDCCDILHGDQCIWWVINDVGNVKTNTNTPTIGIEIHCQAFAFATTSDAINNATFYQYKMINKSSETYTQFYFGQWVDADLGYYLDDFVRCDAGKGVGFCYNGDLIDDLPDGYGATPPVIGIDILHGPLADAGDGIDNNRNGTIDELNEDITMSKFVYYNNNANPVNGEPNLGPDYYNYLKGVWKNNVKMTYGGDGTMGTDTCDFMFPGTTDPLHPVNWTEESIPNVPYDRRFIMSAGPFTILPGEVNCITLGAIWARAATGDNLASIPLMLEADSINQLFFNSCFTILPTSVNQLTEGNITGIAPNPFSEKTVIHFNNPKGENYSFKLFDVNGTLVKNTSSISTDYLAVKKDNLKSGIYIFKLISESGKTGSGKLIVE